VIVGQSAGTWPLQTETGMTGGIDHTLLAGGNLASDAIPRGHANSHAVNVIAENLYRSAIEALPPLERARVVNVENCWHALPSSVRGLARFLPIF
jgi:hypothetical protein